MSEGTPDPASVQGVTKLIQDLQELVALLQQGLSRAKPWQRQLAAHLLDVDTRIQVLRLTIAMERSDAEIVAAAEQLGDLCRLAAAAVHGSRVDPTTRAAIQLVGDMAVRIRAGLESMRAVGASPGASHESVHR